MPPGRLFFTYLNRERFLEWAGKIGESTRRIVEAIFNRPQWDSEPAAPA